MYEIYSLYMINEEEKTATFIDIDNRIDILLKSIGETCLNEGYDRYVIIGVLKNNRHELDGYEIFIDGWNYNGNNNKRSFTKYTK